MIFAREVSDPLTSLVKKIDEFTGQNRAANVGSFVVFCSDAEGLEKQLKELAEKEKFKHLVLAIDNPAGPKDYQVTKDADITVVLYFDFKVVANHVVGKEGLTDATVKAVLADVPKLLQ